MTAIREAIREAQLRTLHARLEGSGIRPLTVRPDPENFGITSDEWLHISWWLEDLAKQYEE